ncbi:hypothetical protein EVAR_21343_1 [Eumeta japonica]|uniref:Uncharacterized protein n=1 Tax=Eumeta variegata TaxID=151549 RepID=A0A4C1YG11_EUMVA|nr:hypothetical protein EVAR_21343_1 [Eumeta japonica]
MRNERQLLSMVRPRAYFANRANPLAIHNAPLGRHISAFGQHHRVCFDGANLSLFLTPQQCARQSGCLLDRRSRLSGEHEDHIIRERLHVYAEFPEFSGRESRISVPSLPVGSLGPGHGVSPGSQGAQLGLNAGHHALSKAPSIWGVLRPRCVASPEVLALSATGAADQHPFHCFAQHGEQTYRTVRLRTGVVFLTRLGITLIAATFGKYPSSRHLLAIARNNPRSRKMAAWHMSEVNPSMQGPFEVECFEANLTSAR